MPNTEELIEKNKKLIEKYPFLKPRYAWSGEEVEDYDYSYTELDAIPDGWRKVYGEVICEDIKECLGDKIDDFYFVQIKEKFGQLRMYDNGATKKWYDQLRKYEYLTENTCICCGKIGVPMTNTGWYLPLCKECFTKQHPKLRYEDFADPDYEFVPYFRYRIYSKGETKTETVDCEDILERIRDKGV